MPSLKRRVASVNACECRVRKCEWRVSSSKRLVASVVLKKTSVEFEKVSSECRLRKGEWRV